MAFNNGAKSLYYNEAGTFNAWVDARPQPPFKNPSRRAARTISRDNGIRPQSTATRGLRTRGTRTTPSPGATTATPGRNTDASIASIRHNGRNTRAACGAATSNATISGCASTARSCDPNPAACHEAARTSHPNDRGHNRPPCARRTATAATPSKSPARAPRRQTRPARNRPANPSIRRKISPNRRYTNNTNAVLKNPRNPQPPKAARIPRITSDRLKEAGSIVFMLCLYHTTNQNATKFLPPTARAENHSVVRYLVGWVSACATHHTRARHS